VPKAILKDGLIHPLEPLPPEWADGRELQVEDAHDPRPSPEELDKWYRELDALCGQNDPAEVERGRAALDEMPQDSKEYLRREMGLP
jgi:hypothetical protein